MVVQMVGIGIGRFKNKSKENLTKRFTIVPLRSTGLAEARR